MLEAQEEPLNAGRGERKEITSTSNQAARPAPHCAGWARRARRASEQARGDRAARPRSLDCFLSRPGPLLFAWALGGGPARLAAELCTLER